MNVRDAIVFIGAAGAGKDTAANFVLEAKPGARNLKFAGALKDICTVTFGWDRERLDTDLDYKEAPAYYPDGSACMERAGEVLTRRQIMQVLGTDMFRQQVNDRVWLQSALATVNATEQAGDAPDFWVVTDARFVNEIDFLKENFDRVYVVRIIREGATQGTAATSHVSERQSAQIEANEEILVADGDLTTLREVARDIAHCFTR